MLVFMFGGVMFRVMVFFVVWAVMVVTASCVVGIRVGAAIIGRIAAAIIGRGVTSADVAARVIVAVVAVVESGIAGAEKGGYDDGCEREYQWFFHGNGRGGVRCVCTSYDEVPPSSIQRK